MTKKRKTVKRTTAKRARQSLPRTTTLAKKRAEKVAAPFIDDLQRAVDEQTQKDFGLAPQSPEKAAAFRKRVKDFYMDEP